MMSQNTESTPNLPENSNGKGKIKVMLADDDKDDQHLFEKALDKAPVDADLTTADDGKELMEKLKDPEIPKPDVVFVDLNMPIKSGKECIEEIKADEELKEIPVIVYSTSSSQKDINDTYSAGANLYVSKPNSFTSIVLILKNIFLFRWSRLSERTDKNDFVVKEDSVN